MVVFVSGGSRGIGRGIVLEAVRQGHDVAFTYVTNVDMARDVESHALTLRADARCMAYQLDVSRSADVETVADRILETFDRVDLVVCNAGVNRDNLLVSMSDEEWHEVIGTNLNGTFFVCRAFLASMLANRFGRIVLVSSVVHSGATGQANYCASKSALHGLAGTIAREYGRRGITANVVIPGFFDTPMTRDTMPDVNKAFWVKYCPVGRMGHLDELAKVVLFLGSDEAAFINGQAIPVTGGLDWAP